MRYLTGSRAALVPFDLVVDGYPVVPDAGQVSWALFMPTLGTTIRTGTVTVPDTSCVATLELNDVDLAHTIDYDLRKVVLTFEVDGISYVKNHHLALIDFILLPVEAAEVRNELSLEDEELPDHHVDLYRAYYEVEEELTSDVVATVRAAGGLKSRALDRMIVARAVLNLLPTLKLRAMRTRVDGELNWQRFQMDDLAKELASHYEGRIAYNRGIITEVDFLNSLTSVVSVVSGTDAITG